MENRNYAIEEFKTDKFKSENKLLNNSAVCKVYPYTNENLRQYINLLNIAGGRVATVGSSGDQAFYSIFKDASEVTLIDGNPYAKPFVELKMSAIKNMKLKEFLNYWTASKALDPKIYSEFIGECSKETVDFFNEIENSGKSATVKARKFFDERFFNIDGFMFKKVPFSVACEFYDDEEKFKTLQDKLKYANLKFELAALKDFPKVLDGEYSTIMLSNIFDYYTNEFEFIDTAKELVDNNLKSHGTMQMHYLINEGDDLEDLLRENPLDNKVTTTYLVERLADVKRYKDNVEDSFNSIYPIKKDYFGDKLLREEVVHIYEKE